jgi:hypothetical protein
VIASTNFVRHIMEISIEKVEEINFNPFMIDYGKINELKMYPDF